MLLHRLSRQRQRETQRELPRAVAGAPDGAGLPPSETLQADGTQRGSRCCCRAGRWPPGGWPGRGLVWDADSGMWGLWKV